MHRESLYPSSQRAEFQHDIQTRWLPAVVYLTAGLFLAAIVRCIGI